jgi:adapter protein MecA 1/2
MVVIVTRGKVNGKPEERVMEEEENDEDVYELEVTLEQSDVVMYSFRDIEDVISVCKQLNAADLTEDGRLYSYNGKYMLVFESEGVELTRYHAIIALLAEYGEATSVTTAVLEEYGKIIMPAKAVAEICTHF